MRKLFIATLMIGALLISAYGVTDDDDHEYASINEKEIEYKTWSYKDINTDETISLRDFSKDKKLVLVFYHAHWCHSSNYQAPVIQSLYEKYKDQGFAVVGVSMYGSLDESRNKYRWWRFTFPVVGESFSSRDRLTSLHYKYRTQTGDERKWATPWNIFLEPSKFRAEGETLVEKAFVANGELIESEAEAFVRMKLGLPELDAASSGHGDVETR